MISRQRIEELLDRQANGNQIFSAFLDMSVNENNKRTYEVFLNREKAEFKELDSDRANHHVEAIGEAFARLERWISQNYEQANRGIAFYTELGGEWTDAEQVPLPVNNRIAVQPRPVVGPLVEILESYHHHGIILVDREHLRLLSIYLNRTEADEAVETEPYPTPHDVKRGGFSAKDFQKRKEEETKHFFKDFAEEVRRFVDRHQPDDLILLGTHENVKRFEEFLSAPIREKVVHRDRMEIEASAADILEKVRPVFEERLQLQEARALDTLRDRVSQDHQAVAGFDATLEQLQEGKLETLVISLDTQREGGRCATCSFVLATTAGKCPYCGGDISDGLDLVEEMVRMAEDKDVELEFVGASALRDLGGVGGLLRF